MLLDVWLAGKRVDGYAFKVWCDATSRPQATYRATAVPVKKAEGARLTVCTDESNVPRTIEGDVAACFAKGQRADAPLTGSPDCALPGAEPQRPSLTPRPLEGLDHHVERAAARVGEQRDERLRLEAERGAQAREQVRSVRADEHARAQAAAHEEVRGGEARDTAVAVVERCHLHDPRVGERPRLLGLERASARGVQPLLECREPALDQLGRRRRGALARPVGSPEARRPEQGRVPGAQRRRR